MLDVVLQLEDYKGELIIRYVLQLRVDGGFELHHGHIGCLSQVIVRSKCFVKDCEGSSHPGCCSGKPSVFLISNSDFYVSIGCFRVVKAKVELMEVYRLR